MHSNFTWEQKCLGIKSYEEIIAEQPLNSWICLFDVSNLSTWWTPNHLVEEIKRILWRFFKEIKVNLLGRDGSKARRIFSNKSAHICRNSIVRSICVNQRTLFKEFNYCFCRFICDPQQIKHDKWILKRTCSRENIELKFIERIPCTHDAWHRRSSRCKCREITWNRREKIWPGCKKTRHLLIAAGAQGISE